MSQVCVPHNMLVTITCCDPLDLQKHIGIQSYEMSSACKPMLKIICSDIMEACTLFYQIFPLVREMKETLVLSGNVIDVPLDLNTPLSTVFTIQSFLYLNWTPVQEQNQIEQGILYSTIFWRRIPVFVQSNQQPVAKDVMFHSADLQG